MLLRTQQYENDIAEARFMISLKAAQLDRTNADEVSKFNTLLESYQALLDPKFIKKKKATNQDKMDILKDFSENFKNIKLMGGKLKNFKKAK